jgi:DNA-directed RNA polymerase specialized sigma subunit
MEKVIAWLESVRKLDELIAAKEAEYDQLMTMATRITPEITGMPHAGGVTDKVGNIATKMAMVMEETNAAWDRYIDQRDQIIRELEKLPEEQYGVLHRHYVLYKTWEQVAEEMGVCSMTVWRYWQKGLKNLADVVECYTIPVV